MTGRRTPDAAPAPFGAPSAAWPAVPGLPRLQPGDRIHLVGIGGAGMSGLARALASRGLVVTGSDRSESDEVHALRREGIAVAVGHAPDQVPPGCALVVRSPAVPDDNPEIAAAHAACIPVAKRAAMLGALLDEAIGVAVAGTHGKTTTSGLVAAILYAAGRDPSFFVGGHVRDLGTNARLGTGRELVIEADEYDRSFLHGHPTIAVITHIEHDHPDVYPDLAAVLDAFRSFAGRVHETGCLIVNFGSPNVAQVIQASSAPVEGYRLAGDPPSAATGEATWVAETESSGGQTWFRVSRGDDSLGRFRLRLPGRHNVANALAAIAVAEALDVPRDVTRRVVAEYRGAERRFQVAGEVGGIVVIDDYAHHPTEIGATVGAARERYAGRRIVALLQPHTYTRVAALSDEFASALAGADRALLAPVYGAREAAIPGATSDAIAAAVPGATSTASLDEAAALVAAEAHAGDVVLCLGAGDIQRASRHLLATLRGRAYEALLSAADGAAGGAVMRDEPLRAHTSLRVGGPADLFVRVTETSDLLTWWRLAHAHGVPVRVLGRGSNVVATDSGFRGLLLLNRCERWSVEPSGEKEALVRADSGVTLAALGTALAREDWSGLEAGVGIPGSVGAAVVCNAGAYGWSMADSVAWVELAGPDGSIERIGPDDLGFGYRTSALRGDDSRVAIRCAIVVRRSQPGAIDERIARQAAHRRETQPSGLSAGSMFRNPPGDYAGRLIEAAGLKGARCGGVAISTLHANFFVNDGTGTAGDVATLIRLAREKVVARTGIWLELEIEPIGDGDVA